MGRRSRKRADQAGPGAARPERSHAEGRGRGAAARQEATADVHSDDAASTRAERDAARRARARRTTGGDRPARTSRPRSARPPASERPPAPWGSFPLSELVILLGILILIWGVFSGDQGQERMMAGLVLASLGGAELALREHLAGFRSHSALLAGVATLAVITVLVLALGTVKVWAITLIAVVVFGGCFYGMRELFKRRSGGLGFR